MADNYDVIVVGGGAGGVAAALKAAVLDAKVAVVEERHLGGFCMNRACIPFGHMMMASRILGDIELVREMGISCREVSKDPAVLFKRQREMISYLQQGLKVMLVKKKIDVITGRGRLAGPGRVDVGGKVLSGNKIILAVGARWVNADFPGVDIPQIVNSDRLLENDRLPASGLLYGSGPWLIQIAQFLHRFGSKVWIATPEEKLLNDQSKTVRSRFAKVLFDQGIKIFTGARVVSLKSKGEGAEVVLAVKGKEEPLSVDSVFSLRRAAAIQGLGVETMGIDEQSGFIKVNERMETGVENLYAVGDITSAEQNHYSHTASSGGLVAGENAMGGKATLDLRTVPRILFTSPQMACIGLTSKEAKDQGHKVVSGEAPYAMNPYGALTSQAGAVEVVADQATGEILGVHMLGDGACEMAGHGVIAIQKRMTLEEMARVIFPHATMSESLAEAARDALGMPIYLP
jgi:dihydrolipoamide dehydrogenase